MQCGSRAALALVGTQEGNALHRLFYQSMHAVSDCRERPPGRLANRIGRTHTPSAASSCHAAHLRLPCHAVCGLASSIGFKVKTSIGRWQIDGFAMRPDLDKPGFVDNAPDHSVEFWGVYGVRPLTKASLWTLTTLVSTENQPHSTEVSAKRCGTASVRVSLVPSPKRNPVGISTTKRFGNLAASAPQYPGMDCGIGNRVPVSDCSAETAIQRQGRHLEGRRSQDEYSRYVQSLVP